MAYLLSPAAAVVVATFLLLVVPSVYGLIPHTDFTFRRRFVPARTSVLLHSAPATPDYEGRLPSDLSPASGENVEGEGSSTFVRPFRCGFSAIVGLPNAGKSTLLNALLSLRLSSTSRLPQTTRHAILGAVTSSEHATQILFLDTPGIIADPAYVLQEGMVNSVLRGMKGADVAILVTDVYGSDLPGTEWIEKLTIMGDRVVVVINKVDLVHDADAHDAENVLPLPILVQKWRALLPDCRAILPISAAAGSVDADPGLCALSDLLLASPSLSSSLRNIGRPLPGTYADPDALYIGVEDVLDFLPEGPPLYPEDTLTDRSERFVASEMVREGIFECLGAEVPYCCEARVLAFQMKRDKEGKNRIDVEAVIFVERESQVAIVVGKKGSMIKKVGIEARKLMEDFFECQIYLDLRVKVDKGWRKNENRLKDFGYM
uniref:KH type-2 domain-containing protein n=1 Tax=Corethron hystrix TaxID=216773 RepID=A0A6U5KBE0_9STRA|mmetsp:Transcript_40073/g.94113  ORF Transcript_40073/g.94113 Transcript_40073/m.94113 type:complete len:432 (+) Transcript_40073:119-1414(+)|eukprot:CAMPEP_0113305734 /NCGR_PEP_ID=MMETSP0010_2-20120614/5250_1 /TAXON_ID=216773 ORGANISM="Corethron hystrix, Strain 308" /NCGR_SAMPLE_ID=MMETSP0010_2 /ASSEMBLY_ACC=CAM_ASM_000155 /LENGTH=431 /DNA_ID=CAMNT_0000160227 /DNA_START=70 /DNA_END=1365 /DNA_ORIENTATION=+ /assembly_acc=CAM_ASM_000155